MRARIYLPARSAMTSGEANTRKWVLEFFAEEPRSVDPLMGWTSSGDMNSQVRLRFESKEAAIEYAERNGMAYVVEAPRRRGYNVRPRGYGGNYAHDRRSTWTH
ncbi:MAG TPA: ETC complex I subunit [Paracoccaceae bacterium]|nr:ETC complex I subunit [Paracoccaceae bacterium]